MNDYWYFQMQSKNVVFVFISDILILIHCYDLVENRILKWNETKKETKQKNDQSQF